MVFSRMALRSSIPVAALGLWIAGPALAQKVERLPIVDKAIAHHGGDLYRSSRTSLTVSSASGEFHLVVERRGGDFDLTAVGQVGPNKIERKVRSTNTSVERWENGEKIELDERTAQQSRDFVNARVYFPFLPFGLNDQNVFKEDLGIETWEGRRLHKVRVTFQPGTSTDADDTYMYWFDPDSGEMVMFAYDFKVGDGGLRLRKVVRSWREGGILFTDTDNWAQDGQGLSVNSLTPDYVKEHMHLMSTVKLTDVKVTPLGS